MKAHQYTAARRSPGSHIRALAMLAWMLLIAPTALASSREPLLWDATGLRTSGVRFMRIKEARFANVDVPTAVAALADQLGLWAGIEALEGDDLAFGGESRHTFSLTAKDMTLESLLLEIARMDPRYEFGVDYASATVNVYPRYPTEGYWATRKVASFKFDGGTAWDAIGAVLRVPELAGTPLRLARQGPWPQEDAPNGPFDRDGDPICFTLNERKGLTVRQLLNLVAWKSSSFWAHRWVAMPKAVAEMGGAPVKRIMVGLSVGNPMPANHPEAKVTVQVDPTHQRQGPNPNGPDW